VSIDSEVLNESVSRIFFIGNVLRSDDDIKSRRIVDKHIAVAVEYRAPRRRDWYLADSVVFGARLIIIVPRDLQHVEPNAQRDEDCKYQVLNQIHPQLQIESFVFQVRATHRTSFVSPSAAQPLDLRRRGRVSQTTRSTQQNPPELSTRSSCRTPPTSQRKAET